MSFDPLKSAMDATAAKVNNVKNSISLPSTNALTDSATAALNDRAEAAADAAQEKLDAAQEKLDALAKYKDPEFLKKEAEAKAMALIADKQQEILAQKADIEAQIAEKITLLITLSAIALKIYFAYPIKLPSIDVKAAAKKAYAKTKKEIRELRQKVSKENLKKGKETFKYPMKPKELSIPKIPEIPKLPEIPKIPKLPEIPKIPTLP